MNAIPFFHIPRQPGFDDAVRLSDPAASQRAAFARNLPTFLTLIFCILLLVPPSTASAQGKPLVLFATLTEDTPVTLADGARWMMDKGDSFPVLRFKDQQTNVMLQLAGTSFLAPVARVRILEEHQITNEELAAYRRNVVNYLEGKVKKWRQAANGETAE